MLLPLWSVPAALATGTPPTQAVIWPDDRNVAPRDAVVYVADFVPGLSDPPITRDADGAVVAVTSHHLAGVRGSIWRVLVPDEELVPGGYTVTVGGESETFTVGTEAAAIVGPPSPYRRWLAAGCEDPEPTLAYRVCGGGILHVAALGDTEPPAPSLDDPGDALVAAFGEDTLSLAEDFGASAGWSGTVWVGDLDEAGRFTGWSAGDAVTLPDGSRTSEGPIGTNAGGSTTPTSVPTCPSFSGWELIEEEDCTPVEIVTTTETTTEPAEGCGCRSTTSAVPAWMLLLALFRRRFLTRS